MTTRTDDHAPDDALYFASNPDLAHAFDRGVIETPGAHWRDAGASETAAGARPTLPKSIAAGSAAIREAAVDPAFDTAFYLDMNADLASVFAGDAAAARRHWAEHGSLEGRLGAGDAPFRDRRPDLASLFARPFGVDLHLSIDRDDPAAVVGRRLLASFRRAGVAAAIHLFSGDDHPRLAAAEAERAGLFRISLVAASPQGLRRLARAYPAGHFDGAYLIWLWPGAVHVAHWPDYPAFALADEIWTTAAPSRDALAAVAPIPVRLVGVPALPLPPRDEARALLGVPAGATAIMLDEDDLAADLVSATRTLPVTLLLRTAAWSNRVTGPHCLTVSDQRFPGRGSLVLAACDAMITRPGLAADIADARARRIAVLEPTPDAIARFLRGPPPPPAAATGRPATVAQLLSALELDRPPPAFTAHFGRSASVALPVPKRPAGQRLAPAMPIVSILLDARCVSIAALRTLAEALARAAHPFWELCLAAGRATARALLPDDPRIRLAAMPASFARVPALNRAADLATGTHLLVARSLAEAHAAAAGLAAIAARLATAPDADLLIAADAPVVGIDRLEAGGAAMRPVAVRRAAFERAGRFRDACAPAAEYDLLLRLSRGPIATVEPARAPARDPDPPAAEEAGRLALAKHLRTKLGPVAYAEHGLQPGTYRRRLRPAPAARLTVIVSPAGSLDAATLPRGARLLRAGPADAAALSATEHLIFLDDRIARIEAGGLEALADYLDEEEIGAVGGRVLRDDGTDEHAGEPLRLVVHNPPSVTGVLATRRTVLLQAGGLLDADYCLRLTRDLGLRVTYTPAAAFRLAVEAPIPSLALELEAPIGMGGRVV